MDGKLELETEIQSMPKMSKNRSKKDKYKDSRIRRNSKSTYREELINSLITNSIGRCTRNLKMARVNIQTSWQGSWLKIAKKLIPL